MKERKKEEIHRNRKEIDIMRVLENKKKESKRKKNASPHPFV
jgi:hypothetical protein